MRYEQNAVLNSLNRAQQFLDAHRDVLDAVNTSTRKQLDRVAAQLADLSISQQSGINGAIGQTALHRAQLKVLRRYHMAPIAVIAKLELRAMPEFASLTMPPAHSSAARLVVAAFSMADSAARYADVLIESGLPATFADDLRAAATAASESNSDGGMHRIRRISATAGLAAAQQRGRALLSVLDSLITARVGDNAPLVAEWRSAKKVGRKPGPPSGRGQPVEVTPIHPADGVAPSMPATEMVLAAA